MQSNLCGLLINNEVWKVRVGVLFSFLKPSLFTLTLPNIFTSDYVSVDEKNWQNMNKQFTLTQFYTTIICVFTLTLQTLGTA